MTLNIVIKTLAPVPPYPCALVEVNPDSVPFHLYGLWLKSQRYFWTSPEEWTIARSMLAEEGSRLLMPCGIDIVNAVDRVYNLLDVRLAGNERSVSGDGTDIDPFVYSPPLEQAATNLAGINESLLLYAKTQHDAWLNLLNGETNAPFTDDRNFRTLLADLKTAIDEGVGGESGILAKLAELIILAG